MLHFDGRVRSCLVIVVGCCLGVARGQGGPTTAPSVTQTPEEIVTAWRSPGLKVPDGPRVNETSPRTVQLLGEALRREGTTVDRRVELVRDLGETQREEAAAFITAALADGDPRVRAAAAQAAAALGRPELAAAVAGQIDDTDPGVRAQATIAHAKLTAGRQKASAVVLKALGDADPGVRFAAISHAATEDEADAIAHALTTMPPRLQLAGIEAIGRIGATGNTPAVAEMLKGGVGQQVAAIRSLAKLNAGAHAPAIVALLQSPHPAVRRAAVEALPAVMPEAEARAAAERKLDDPDAAVRAAAAAGAAPVQGTAVVNRLLQLLGDPYLPVHDAALATLARAGNDDVKAAIVAEAVKLLDARQARRRQDGSFLLGAYRSTAGLEKQLALLSATAADEAVDEQVMIETVRALGLIRDPRAKDAVMDVVNRGSRAVTSQAASADVLAGAAVTEAIVAAALLGDTRVLEPARKFMNANPEMTPAEPRAAGAWAVGQVADASDRASGGILAKLYNSQFDTDETKIEAVKAMGRLKLAGSRGLLETAAKEAASPRLRWMATWSLWRITGQEPTYDPPKVPWRASVAIEDVTSN